MNTEHPTTWVYFVWAFTYCKVKVYVEEADFLKNLFGISDLELCDESENDGKFTEIDTRMLLAIICHALPKMIADIIPIKEEMLKNVIEKYKIPKKV